MPRCLMAKKWKAYPWPDRQDDEEETGICNVETVQEKRKMAVEMEDEEIDVVGDSTSEGNRANQQTCWGPHSPTAGTTAPSPPPLNASGALYYNGYNHETWLNHDEPPKYATLRSAAELAEPTSDSSSEYYDQQQQSTSPLSPLQNVSRVQSRTKSLSMCFTSTGAALSLPPKKKDIYRPYSLQTNMEVLRTSPEEELSAAQAILDLSASPVTASNSVFLHSLSLPPASSNSSIQSNTSPSEPTAIPVPVQLPVPSHNVSNKQDRNSDSLPSDNVKLYPNNTVDENNLKNNKTVAYTYEAFFVSDGRSKRRSTSVTVPEKEPIQSDKPKFTCTECGKQYATSSNLSRHKQTHRSLDSQSAKKCIHCGKAYVSMPALAMHVLTHKLTHSCGICGKMFSRPWLLQGHLRSHTGEKPYGCAHCGKAFADRSNLRAHMQTHSSDKNYECSRCHKTFALKSYLNKHSESACLRDEEMHVYSSDQIHCDEEQSPQLNRGL